MPLITRILFVQAQDGPSQDLRQQLDLDSVFSNDLTVEDFAALDLMLDHDTAGSAAVFFVMPQDGLRWSADNLVPMIRAVCDRASCVILLLTETDILIQHLCDLCEIDNLWIMAPAQHNFVSAARPMTMWQHWIQDLQQTWLSADVAACLDQIRSVTGRPFLFDVLLGGERPYRSLLYDLVESDSQLRDRVLMTYYGRPGSRPQFISEPEVADFSWEVPFHTSMQVQFRSVPMRAACIPPISIYRQTWFTVVTETSAHGYLNFYTEKVAKPLLAGRVFLAMGGQHYLRGLRDCGFQTFGDMIDESYDTEPDDSTRIAMIFREMQRLSLCDPEKILSRLQPVIQHNQQLAWNTNFFARALADVQQQITQT